MTELRIVLHNDLSEIERLGRELKAFGEKCSLSAKTLFELNLMLEEVVANVIAYAYEDARPHEITIRAALENREITVEVEDDGRPFNPLQFPPPERGGSIEEMKVGGLGLHLVRELADSLAYERTAERNRFIMRKKAT